MIVSYRPQMHIVSKQPTTVAPLNQTSSRHPSTTQGAVKFGGNSLLDKVTLGLAGWATHIVNRFVKGSERAIIEREIDKAEGARESLLNIKLAAEQNYEDSLKEVQTLKLKYEKDDKEAARLLDEYDLISEEEAEMDVAAKRRKEQLYNQFSKTSVAVQALRDKLEIAVEKAERLQQELELANRDYEENEKDINDYQSVLESTLSNLEKKKLYTQLAKQKEQRKAVNNGQSRGVVSEIAKRAERESKIAQKRYETASGHSLTSVNEDKEVKELFKQRDTQDAMELYRKRRDQKTEQAKTETQTKKMEATTGGSSSSASPSDPLSNNTVD